MAMGMGDMKVGGHAAAPKAMNPAPGAAAKTMNREPAAAPAGAATAGAARMMNREPGAAAGGPPGFFERYQKLPDSRFETSESGLKSAQISEGTGPEAGKGMSVVVRYTGWTEDGKKFDSSETKGKPFEFTLGAGTVIKGWEEALDGAKVGDRLQLVIPAKLAYGNRQVGEIPPNSTLVFNVEVVSVRSGSPNTKGTMSVVA